MNFNEKVFNIKTPFLNYYTIIASLVFNKMDYYYRSIDSTRVKESFMFLH